MTLDELVKELRQIEAWKLRNAYSPNQPYLKLAEGRAADTLESIAPLVKALEEIADGDGPIWVSKIAHQALSAFKAKMEGGKDEIK